MKCAFLKHLIWISQSIRVLKGDHYYESIKPRITGTTTRVISNCSHLYNLLKHPNVPTLSADCFHKYNQYEIIVMGNHAGKSALKWKTRKSISCSSPTAMPAILYPLAWLRGYTTDMYVCVSVLLKLSLLFPPWE